MARSNRQNYYRLLHVQPDAPTEVIRASYRTMMQRLKYHPDLGGDEWNATLINEAYAVLSVAETRARYDRTRASFERGHEHAEASSTLALPGHGGNLQRAETLNCAFCCATNYRGREVTDPECGGCGAPLRLVALPATTMTRRETERIEHPGEIRYRVDALQPESMPGRCVDLSPTGLRFMSEQRLADGSVIQIESPSLSAVARVTRTMGESAAGPFSTGVRFLTLKVRRPRGTFVSTLA